MPHDSFKIRFPENVAGKFYVTDQCLDCDLCRETAPTVFQRADEQGYAFVAKQPETEEELVLAREALTGCPCEAIFEDGDLFDWSVPRGASLRSWFGGRALKPKCKHCHSSESINKPWWRFW